MPPRSARQLPAVAARLVVDHQALAWFPLATVAVDMAAAATVAAIRGPSQSASALAAAAVDPSTLGDALADAPTALDGGITVALAVIVGSAITGLLRAGFLTALAGVGPALPPRLPLAGRLAVVFGIVDGLGVAVAAIGDDLAGLPVLVALLAAIVAVLYADYAMVVHDCGIAEGIRRSLRVVRARLRPSLVILFTGTLLGAILSASADPGSEQTVDALVLASALLGAAMLGFVLDALLVTLYQWTDGEPEPPAPAT